MTKIGFIGQGWIGKNMADDFEERGYEVVRYSREEPYTENKDKISECEIVFIAVPTPTTLEGSDSSIVRSVLELVGNEHIAVIKSTMLPGTTRKLQSEFPGITILHSPEFLREKHAVEDTKHPSRNIIGVVRKDRIWAAKMVLQVLPTAKYNRIVSAESAECIKYIGNNFLTTKIVFFNTMYDMANAVGADWDEVRESVVQDDRIGDSHTNVIDQSGEGTVVGRGAGGHCFIKDLEALLTEPFVSNFDPSQQDFLGAVRHENNRLLVETNKDIDLLSEIYGDEIK